MNFRTVCRICKTEGVRLHCITNTHLQEMYERKIQTLLTTDDNKPTLACIECCDRLQHCYQLTNGVEQRENTHTMMNLDPQLQIHQNDIHQNIQCVKIEPEHLSDVEVKQESTSDEENGTYYLPDNDIKLEADSDTDHGSALKVEVESMNVNQNEANVLTKKNKEVNQAPKIENPEDISRKLNNSDRTRNNAARKHTGASPFVYDVCKKSVSTKNNLVVVQHAPIHTSEKPFSCNLCKKYFKRKSHVVQHSRVHSRNKCYECDKCKTCFWDELNLLNHTCTHTVEKCIQCVVCKIALSPSAVARTRLHADEKPFKCDACMKRYRYTYSRVTKHTRTH